MRERHRDRLADAAALALDESAEDALERVVRGADRAERRAHERGPGSRRQDEKEVEAPIAAITIDSQPFTDARRESSPNALMRAWTSRGFERAQVVGAEPESSGDAGAPPVDEHVAAVDQRRARSARSSSSVRSTRRLCCPRAQNFHADCDRSREPLGWFQQPHLGARVGEHLTDDRGGQRVGGGHDAEAGEGARLVVGTWRIPALCQ